ncbi:MAG: hypothetical protein KGJ13_08570 [Patescibacteria group bacterium]|nr:hypothetical protein [Patescibacteria group bacterium]
MWLQIVFPTVLAAIKAAFKNPKKAAEVREYALQLATWIELTWGRDPLFQAALNERVDAEKKQM